ncbi:hypothetical protein M758_10G037500 [Ceratodon purpureus]|nr:hypothetical protein M758_10G037500 [Ceratodon purpureus]
MHKQHHQHQSFWKPVPIMMIMRTYMAIMSIGRHKMEPHGGMRIRDGKEFRDKQKMTIARVRMRQVGPMIIILVIEMMIIQESIETN